MASSFPFSSFASAPLLNRPGGLFLDLNRTNGFDMQVDNNTGKSVTRITVGDFTSTSSSSGITFVTRKTMQESQNDDNSSPSERVLAHIGLDGNIYVSGSISAGGLPSSSVGQGMGTGTGGVLPFLSSSPWKIDRDVMGNEFTVIRKPTWSVGLGDFDAQDPPAASLHVKGGGVIADFLRGSLPFSYLTGVPRAIPDVNEAGLVKVADIVPPRSSVISSLSSDFLDRVASMKALLSVREESERYLKKAGDVMTGDLVIREAAQISVAPGGRVGVGISEGGPKFELDVNGDVNFTGSIKRNGKDLPLGHPWKLDTTNGKVYLSSDSFRVGVGKSDPRREIDVRGTVRASFFEGDGGGLENLGLGNLTRGTLPVERGGTGNNELEMSKILVGMGRDPVLSAADLHWDSQNGRLGIQEAVPQDSLHVEGNIRVSGSVFENSDERLKMDLVPLSSGVLQDVLQLRGYRFKRCRGNDSTPYELGLLAQDVLRVFPEAVHEDESTGMLSVSYTALIGALIEALRDLREEKDRDLRNILVRLDALENN